MNIYNNKKLGRPFNIKTKWRTDTIKYIYVNTKTNESRGFGTLRQMSDNLNINYYTIQNIAKPSKNLNKWKHFKILKVN